MSLALAGCSTCDHSSALGYWDPNVDSTKTGNVEVQLAPLCFVRDTTSVVPLNTGFGLADNNFKNCGDVIDYDAYLTNRSDATLTNFKLELRCPTLE